jgi:hypothetical protein
MKGGRLDDEVTSQTQAIQSIADISSSKVSSSEPAIWAFTTTVGKDVFTLLVLYLRSVCGGASI